ncbi:hypothetical protein CEXT_358551 [Caerostris extrusa]|uniref:Uncharacterized protein n=1 Tax=Caerostris extrusa TaxID=172846 RepID=A0AAV4XA24_CAEEX|nr:hypothetical protein CEXT_358551 [Caerostris extrusa]
MEIPYRAHQFNDDGRRKKEVYGFEPNIHFLNEFAFIEAAFELSINVENLGSLITPVETEAVFWHKEASSYLKDKTLISLSQVQIFFLLKDPKFRLGGKNFFSRQDGTMEIPNRAHQFNDDGREQRNLRF